MLGNGEFLAEEERQQKLAAERTAAWNALSPEEKAARTKAKAEIDAHIRLLNSQRPTLNRVPPVKLPLNSYEEKVRRAYVSGDWNAVQMLWPVSKFSWGQNTPLGKYRFNLVNGIPHYIPWTRTMLEQFVNKYAPGNKFGYSSLIEPGRNHAECNWEKIVTDWMTQQNAHQKQYPVTDWRHTLPIYTGRYICQVYRPSTWVKIRKPVIGAVLITGAIFLGPAIGAKIGSLFGEGSSGAIVGGGTKAGAVAKAGVVAEKATLFSRVQSGVAFVNKARTVNAIIKGELPPPPFGISGATFADWAFDIAKKEIVDSAVEKAVEYGATKYIEHEQKKQAEAFVAQEEAKIRAEIAELQRLLAKELPGTFTAVPSEDLDPEVRAKIIAMQNIERENAKQSGTLLALAAGGALLMVA